MDNEKSPSGVAELMAGKKATQNTTDGDAYGGVMQYAVVTSKDRGTTHKN